MSDKQPRRPICARCQRPQALCLCSTFQWIDNQVKVIILQHPTEVKKPFATRRIVENTLRNCQIFVGEDFSQEHALLTQVADPNYHTFLVFPLENDQTLKISPKDSLSTLAPKLAGKNIQLLFIDGTWRKAKKIAFSNEFLQRLPSISLENFPKSEYTIRKSSLASSLALVEACYYALSFFAPAQDFAPLLNAFRRMVDQQIAQEQIRRGERDDQ